MQPCECGEFVRIIYNTHFLLHNGCILVQGMRAKSPWCLKQKRPDRKWFYDFYGQRELPWWALLWNVSVIGANTLSAWSYIISIYHGHAVLKIFNLSWSSKYPCLKLLTFLSCTGKTDRVVSQLHALTTFLVP